MEEEKVVEISNKNMLKAKRHSKLMIVTSALTWMLYLITIIAYLLIGCLAGIWHPTWVIFFAPIIIASLILAIGERKPRKFCYPIFVVAIYVLFGATFSLWHPLWVLFITIPLYYSFFSFIKKLKG